MKKIISALLVFFFLHTQSIARAQQGQMDLDFSRMATQITQGQLNSDEIIAQAHRAVADAKAAGVTEEEFVSKLSEKLALNMSAEDVRKTVEDMKADHSPSKISQLAESLKNNQKGDKFLMVLLTFALLTALWIGIFFILADPHYPH